MARNITDITGSKYYTVDQSLDYYGVDMEFRIKFWASNVTNDQWLWSDWVETGNNRSFALRLNGGNLQVFSSSDGSAATQLFSQAVTVNQIHNVKVRIIGLTAYLTLDDAAEISTPITAQLRNTNATKLIGGKTTTGSLLNGRIFDIKIWRNGDADTGILEYDYRLDDSWTDSLVAFGIGAETTAVGITDADAEFFYFNTDTVPWSMETLTATSLDFGYTVGWALIWLIGQSNMVGRATAVGGIDDDYSLIDGCKQFGYNAQTILAATNPLDHVDEGGSSMGMWLQFAKDIAQVNKYDQPILFVPAAQGGTGFSNNFWNPGDTLNTNARNSVIAALATETSNTLAAVFWLQGESDADAQSTTYLADITAMHTDFITQITEMTADTAFIACSILGSSQPAQVPVINAALSTFVDSLNEGAYVDATDQTLFDTYHYDAPSLRTIGTRYAQQLTLLGGAFPVMTVPFALGNADGITAAATNVNISVSTLPDLVQVATNTISWGADAKPEWQQPNVTSGVTYNVTFRDNATGNTGSIDITAV